MAQHRIDITPKIGEFDWKDTPERGVSLGEAFAVLVALAAIAAIVVAVDDVWIRLAGVLLVTGALAAMIAQRVLSRRADTHQHRPH